MAKILVVEDDTGLQDFYKIFLELNHHDFVIAGSKKEALDQIQILNPQILLIDVMLSGVDGRDICREIRATNKDVKIILLSANHELLVNYEECGADVAIEKPFSIKTILSTINNFVAKTN